MSRIFFAPSKYVQGAGAISSIGKYAETLGKKALLVGQFFCDFKVCVMNYFVDDLIIVFS